MRRKLGNKCLMMVCNDGTQYRVTKLSFCHAPDDPDQTERVTVKIMYSERRDMDTWCDERHFQLKEIPCEAR